MNFSTVPPWRPRIVLASSNQFAIRARTASGSRDSPSAVEPTTSAKRTVTVFRTSRAGAASTSGAPQAPQKRNPSGFSWPHWAQIRATEASVGHRNPA